MNAKGAASLIVVEMGLDNGCRFRPTKQQMSRLEKALKEFHSETGVELDNEFCVDMGCGLCYYGMDSVPMVWDEQAQDYVPWVHRNAKSWSELDMAIDDIYNGYTEEE